MIFGFLINDISDDLIPENNFSDTFEWGSAFTGKSSQTWNQVWATYFDLDGSTSLAGQTLWKNFLLGGFIILAFSILFLVWEIGSSTRKSDPELSSWD